MITVTVSGRDAEALTARLAELLAGTGVQLGPTAPQLSVVSGGRAAGPRRARRRGGRSVTDHTAAEEPS